MKLLLPLFTVMFALAGAQPYEHVVITARSHIAEYALLSSWLESELRMSDTVVAIEDVIAICPGRDDAEKVRSFIRDAYTDWGTTHVLLGGDVDVIPHRRAYVHRYGRTQHIPCDLYFSDLDGDWDLDGDNVFGELEDSVDLYPDIAIGRAAVSAPDLAARFVNKVLVYSSDSTASYLDQVLLAGFDLYEEPVIRGEYHCEIVDTTHIPASMGPRARVYDSHSGNHKAAILQELNAGQHIWVHADHSSWWSVGAGYLNHGATINFNEMQDLSNGTNYTIGLINGCHVGAFDSSDCVAEGFLSAPDGGGVAAFVNARPGLTIGPDWHRAGSYLQAQQLIDRLLNQGANSSLGVLAQAQGFFAPLADTSPTYRWCQYQYNLLGEPAMPVWVPEFTGISGRGEAGLPGPHVGPTVVRGVLSLRQTQARSTLVSAAGRRVMNLVPGKNDIGRLSPGIYFVSGEAGTTARVVVTK